MSCFHKILAFLLYIFMIPVCLAVKPQASEGYIGATFTDNAAGQTVFSWFYPGPLDGDNLQSGRFDLQRPDVLVSIDGKSLNAKMATHYIQGLPVGSEAVIEYEPAVRRKTSDIPAEVKTTGERKLIKVTVVDSREFSGTIGNRRLSSREWTPPQTGRMLAPFDAANILGKAVLENGLTDSLKTLKSVFREFIERTSDSHMLSRVRAGFSHPFALPELEREMTNAAREMKSGFFMNALRMAADNMDLVAPEKPELHEEAEVVDAIVSKLHLTALKKMIEEAKLALGSLWNNEDFAKKAVGLLRVPLRTLYISGPDSRDHLSVIRASIEVDFERLLGAMAYGDVLVAEKWVIDPDAPQINPPAELNEFIQGEITAAENHEGIGWVVVGGFGNNRYDMSKIAMVIEPDGDDEYYMSGPALGVRVIIDLKGDDIYAGYSDQGPGGALLGLSLIDDRAGNDTYTGELLSSGAACFGVSILIDRAGNDSHIGGEWAQGAGCYGAGMLLSLGGGSDVYISEFLSQGVGGPRGFGLLFDEAGNDLYRANGPYKSAYGTPAVYKAFSQGIGFGYRGYAAGGIGMLCDMAGNDRYEAGEFAQGGAYYYALGILYDASGDDFYYGNRYSQGFGVHQAMGVLADDEGNDTYWSMTSSSQGSAWDVGVGLLLDRAGNDTYRCDGTGQGGASMQSIGMLIDLGGYNHYSSSREATQGESGGNSYHYHDTGAFSFSLLMNLGDEDSFYSTGRKRNNITKTGSVIEDRPENSKAWGLVIDAPAP